MSATIYWRRVSNSNKTLPVSAPSSFITAMERAFGAGPWIMSGDCLQTLRGMSACYGGPDRENPFDAMIRLIDQENGTTQAIEVWTVY
jgi:hypothetical protein